MIDGKEFETWYWESLGDQNKPIYEAAREAWQAARQQAGSSDRDVLVYLMNRFDSEEWNCPQCGHSEPTSDMDSAIHLREYLAAAPQAEQAVEPVAILCREIGETSWFDHNPLVPGSPTDLARQRSPQWDTCRVFAEAPPAPDVSGQVQMQSLLEGALRSLNAGEMKDVRQRLEAAIDAHKQEGKRQCCEYAGCCSESIGATRLCADHQEQQP